MWSIGKYSIQTRNTLTILTRAHLTGQSGKNAALTFLHCIFWETPDFKARRGSGQEQVEFSRELIRCLWSWQITNWHAYGSRQCRHEDTVARWGLRFIRPTRSNIALLLFVRPCTGIIIRRTSIGRCYRFPVRVLYSPFVFKFA